MRRKWWNAERGSLAIAAPHEDDGLEPVPDARPRDELLEGAARARHPHAPLRGARSRSLWNCAPAAGDAAAASFDPHRAAGQRAQ